jgi:transposase-like protein
MPDEFICDICSAPMKIEKRGKSTSGNRIRRFACTVCDFKKTIFAGGDMDEKFIPEQGIEAVKRMFKKEEDNRNT